MAISPKRRIQMLQILAITLFWLLCGVLLTFYKCVTYASETGRFVFLVPWNLSLGNYLLINMVGPLVAGPLGGSFLVLYLNERMRSSSYLRYQLASTLFFFVFIVCLNCLVSYSFYYQSEILSSTTPFREAVQLLFDPYAIRNILTWMAIAFLTLHGLRVTEKYGPAAYFRLLIGKFHRPREVERVFMFLDLSNATAIAERLGHRRFFELLREFYADATEPILNCRGQIYQYVGDEICVSWPIPPGKGGGLNILQCFFQIEQAMARQAQKYRDHYGLVPAFKAALHYGSVVEGEMGVVKREIVYSGDILNTTARILEQCRHYKQKLIVSQDVLQTISPEAAGHYNLVPLGNLLLRGKQRPVHLFGLSSKQVSAVTPAVKSEYFPGKRIVQQA